MQRPSLSLVIAFIVFAISLPYSLHAMKDTEKRAANLEKDVTRVEKESESAHTELVDPAKKIAKETNIEEIKDLLSEYKKESDRWQIEFGDLQTGVGGEKPVEKPDMSKYEQIGEERPPPVKERPRREEEYEEEAERRRIAEEQRAALQKETELRMREEERRMREVERRTREAEEARRVEEEVPREPGEIVEETITERITPGGREKVTVRRRIPPGVKLPSISGAAKETTADLPIPKSIKEEIAKKEKELERKEEEFERKKREFEVRPPEVARPFDEPTRPVVTPEYPGITPTPTPTPPVVTETPFAPTQPGVTPTPPGAPPVAVTPKEKWWKKKPRGYQTAQEFDDDWNKFLYDEEGIKYLRSLQQPAPGAAQPQYGTPPQQPPRYGGQNETTSTKKLYVMYSPTPRTDPYYDPYRPPPTTYQPTYPQQPAFTGRISSKKMRKELEEYERSYMPELILTKLLEIGKKINKVVDRDDVVDFIGVVAKLPDFFRLIGKKRLADIKAVDLEGKRIKAITIYKHPIARIEKGEIPSPVIQGYEKLLELVTEKNKILKGILEANKPLEKKIKRILIDYKPDFQRDLKYRTKAIKRKTLGLRFRKTETGTIRVVIKELNKLYDRYDKIRKHLLLKGKISSKDATEYVKILSVMYDNILEDPEEDVVNSFAALVKKTLGEGSFLATFLKDPKWWRTSIFTKFAKYKLQTIEDIKTDVDLHKIKKMKKKSNREAIGRLKATQDLLGKLKGAPAASTEVGAGGK